MKGTAYKHVEYHQENNLLLYITLPMAGNDFCCVCVHAYSKGPKVSLVRASDSLMR